MLIALLLACVSGRGAAGRGADVAVVFNKNLADSRGVAEHYAARRGVPGTQLIELDLPTEEVMTRGDYLARLQGPLLAKLEALKLIGFGPATNRAADGRKFRRVVEGRIRYVVLCYGVPLRILRDDSLVEPMSDQIAGPMAKRSEAAVDSQLAIAPMAEQGFLWVGPLVNPFLGATNAALMNPMNGLFIVARLDGPSPAIAKGLVDKALAAETNGFWGRAYLDARGLETNNAYYAGDAMLKSTAGVLRRVGFETVLDERAETFSAGYPMSQIAFYAGWYDQTISGPFTQPKVEFMPGAFAYHLYSFGASSVRTSNTWAGRLLSLGAACTLGAVDEPYLTETPDIAQLALGLSVRGFTFGEAAYAALPSVSWQTTVIGDPLYRPFGRTPDDLLADVGKRNPELLEWYFQMAVNQKTVAGASVDEAIHSLMIFSPTRQSAVLTEKLGDLLWGRGSLSDGADIYEAALKRGPSDAQRRRLLLGAAEKRTAIGPDEAALAHYETFLKENPEYPERLKVYRAMLPVARRHGLTNDVTRIEGEIQKLSR